MFLGVRLYCSFVMEYDIHTLLDMATLVTTLWVIYMIRFKLNDGVESASTSPVGVRLDCWVWVGSGLDYWCQVGSGISRWNDDVKLLGH